PVLDGLDETPPGLHTAAIDAVDQAIAGGRPLVITCRSAEYEQAVLRDGSFLCTAAVVEIEPVNLGDAAAFLTARQPPGRSRWPPVVGHLRLNPHGPLACALTPPLIVDLARAAYADPARDPAELCDAIRFPDRASVEEHLLDAFLPAAYPQHPPPPFPAVESRRAARRRYRPEQAQQWLTFLAQQLDRMQTHDLAWWQLPRAIPRLTQGVLFGLPAGVMFAIAGELAGGYVIGAIYGAAFALAGCTANAVGRRPGPLRVEMRFRGTAPRVVGRFAVGLGIGAGLGLSWSLPPGLIVALVLVFWRALAIQVWLDTPADANRVSSPAIVLNQERVAAVSFTLSFALPLGTFYGVADAFTKQIRFIPILD